MTNLEKFKKEITAKNLCEKIYCCTCPMFSDARKGLEPCYVRLEKWANEKCRRERKSNAEK